MGRYHVYWCYKISFGPEYELDTRRSDGFPIQYSLIGVVLRSHDATSDALSYHHDEFFSASSLCDEYWHRTPREGKNSSSWRPSEGPHPACSPEADDLIILTSTCRKEKKNLRKNILHSTFNTQNLLIEGDNWIVWRWHGKKISFDKA